MFQLVTTSLAFLLLVTITLVALGHRYWVTMALCPISAMLLVRLFMLQHDCGHGSFFPSQHMNNVVGAVLGVLTLTPYTSWRRDHAVHHAHAGNLDQRGIGDITTMTTSEYSDLPGWRRLAYRLYRHPLVMFGVGPVWLFFVLNRIPKGTPRGHRREWLSALGTNAALAAIVIVVTSIFGIRVTALGLLPTIWLAASAGVWLFFIQHQFERTCWDPQRQWTFHTAALAGSSFYDLPPVLHWMTGNIGFHHIHHLSSRIPNYRLRDCHKANPSLADGVRLTLWSSLRCPSLTLWDTESRTLVSFKQWRLKTRGRNMETLGTLTPIEVISGHSD